MASNEVDLCHDFRYPEFSSSLARAPTSGSMNSTTYKLVRTPEYEPRTVVWVYDYSKNTTKRMKVEELLKVGDTNNLVQVSIPKKPGRVPVRADEDDFGGPKTVVARVHISMGLRLQRWLGLQKRVYIIDQVPSTSDIEDY